MVFRLMPGWPIVDVELKRLCGKLDRHTECYLRFLRMTKLAQCGSKPAVCQVQLGVSCHCMPRSLHRFCIVTLVVIRYDYKLQSQSSVRASRVEPKALSQCLPRPRGITIEKENETLAGKDCRQVRLPACASRRWFCASIVLPATIAE